MSTAYDVVVAGAGMGGLTAGLAAAQAGARVLVAEKSGQAGGSMRLSHGFIGTYDTMEAARRHVPDGDEILQELIVDEAEEARQWLGEAGVRLGPTDRFKPEFSGRMTEPPQLIARILQLLEDAGADVRMHAPLHSLVRTGHEVSGPALWLDGRVTDISAGAVVLATGGFQGSPELVQRFITPHASRVYLRSQPHSTGDGLQAALAVGGTTSVGMHAFYGHALPAPPARIGQLEMLEATQRFGDLAVVVNRDGLRFVDESGGTGEESVNEVLATQPGAEALYIIDAAIAERDPGFMGLPLASVILDRARATGARIATAQSLEELVAETSAWGFDGPRTLRTLREYNAEVEAGTHTLFPPRRNDRIPLARPPFSAIAVRCGITFTSGGIAVDADMAVTCRATSSSTMPMSMHDSRDFAMNAVPGLFAAGADVGGVHVGGYMGGLAAALVTGRIAGLSAATAAERR